MRLGRKFEYRISKSETNSNEETKKNPKQKPRHCNLSSIEFVLFICFELFLFELFEFVSNFDVRISDFSPRLGRKLANDPSA